ncbi:glycosyltransferase family 4 protein [Candidatus Gottesmanbacteria bacterium]|nr:glycosyltransferase family 4 protein [Candidatus Gottesmanbacteria bacterium]
MIIGVDAGALSISDERLKVGVWRVVFNLLRELSHLDKENSYRLYSFRSIGREVMRYFGSNMQNIVLTPVTGWSSLRLPLELFLRKPDVFLGLSQSLPASRSRTIGFIYDLGFLFRPDVYGSSAEKLAKQTKQLVDRADNIVTISQASRQDIMSCYHLTGDRVTSCYPGISVIDSNRRIIRKRPYFLFVGSLNRAKDIPVAIEAFASFLKKTQKPYEFILAGGEYWPDPSIRAVIDLYGLQKQVYKVGYVTDDVLAEYYRGAMALVATGFREGFCLPAAEAMACGIPVLAIDRGSLKEVVGGGGIVVEKPEAELLADAMVRMTDRKIRGQFSRRAIALSKRYSWKTFAYNIYKIISMVPSS